jgi:hypothetical protein|tara:strand:- start:111 stop:389 length:279 start_codon:yes stop_codon:yes gene_type:complete
MKVKEILSYHLNDDLGVMYVDFILEENDQEKEINNLEISEDDLLETCELYDSKEWVDWESNDILDIRGEVNEEALYEGVEYYINNTEGLFNL